MRQLRKSVGACLQLTGEQKEPHYSVGLGPLLGKSLEEENKAETVIGLMGPLQPGFLGKLTHDVRP